MAAGLRCRVAARRVRRYAPVAVCPSGPLTEPGCQRKGWGPCHLGATDSYDLSTPLV